MHAEEVRLVSLPGRQTAELVQVVMMMMMMKMTTKTVIVIMSMISPEVRLAVCSKC